MLKIPTFVLGGLLILTGLVGYLFQDPGLSLTITGSLADNANLKLSDGGQTVPMNFQPEKNLSGGQQVFEIIRFSPEDYELDLFGLEHINTKAERRSRTNYVIRNTDTKNKPVSYWMATSKGEPLKALLEQDFSANLKEVKEARLRLVYVNDGDVSGPLKLTADNWKGIKGDHEKGASLAFGPSPTAFIPSLLGLLLIALVVGSEANPNLRKHLMHAAATIALLSFGYLSFKIFGIVKETFWFRQDANIHVSFLKPVVFIFSAGLLFIFLVLCIGSFINARQEMASKPKPKKKKEDDDEDFEDDDEDFEDDDEDFEDDDDDDDDDEDFEDDDDDDFEDDDEKELLKKKGEKKGKDASDEKAKDDKPPTKPLGPAPPKKGGKEASSKPSGLKLTEKKGRKDKETTRLRPGGEDRKPARDEDFKPTWKPKKPEPPQDKDKRKEKSEEEKDSGDGRDKDSGDVQTKTREAEKEKPAETFKREEPKIAKPDDDEDKAGNAASGKPENDSDEDKPTAGDRDKSGEDEAKPKETVDVDESKEDDGEEKPKEEDKKDD